MERLKGTDWYKVTDPDEILDEVSDTYTGYSVLEMAHWHYDRFLQIFVPMYLLKRNGKIELFYAPNYGINHFVNDYDDVVDNDGKYAEDIRALLDAI